MDIQKLKDLAEAATPGPWAFGSFGSLLVVPLIGGEPSKHDPICNLGPQQFPSNTQEYDNAEFIAAANPQTILALLDELESLRSERTAWRVTAENAEKQLEDLKASKKKSQRRHSCDDPLCAVCGCGALLEKTNAE